MIEYDYEDQFKEALAKIQDNNLKKKLVAIKKLVVERLNLENEYKKEHNALEYKYEQMYKPIYEKRKLIIDGTETPKVEEIKDQLERVGLKPEQVGEMKEKGIPNFWEKAISNSHDIDVVTEKDKKILQKLKDVSCETKENGDFTLTFTFEENEFFTPNVLTKEFILDKEFEISEIKSTKIEWKSDEVNPTIELKKKKMKNKKTKEIKTTVKREEVESFFTGFKDYKKSEEKKEEEEEEEEDEGGDSDNIEAQYDFGLTFKDEIIPFAIEYYLGVVEDEDEEEESEEDEDSDEEDDDESEEENKKKKGGKRKKK